ncbi:AAA family ATPase [Paenibacillus herberti]|uniref:Phosphoribulokinase/uridine kinase domain-containing protein n=1 Tax=Paenibacillus herberti TaxID=1619309 RepID=A0A229P3A4_9BACL|nr:AAA family ATPase [Paenibacillus herberti]OXM16567.1 hypothetical protein CGZ75_07855 [Paenibacillus herberti]
MKKGKLPFVIAIAAVSGGGKTTISTHLNEKLENSKTLFFDNYNFDGPEDIIGWVDNGADYDDWDLSPLIKDLEALLTEPLNYIVLDFPFAYKHSKMSKFINCTVFIDTPLDIAMARRVSRDFNNSPVENIIVDMNNYLSQGRRGYLEMLKTIKPNSDTIVDGTLSISEIVCVISQTIDQKFKMT